jgi:8-oxo-dGTP pyrophosphatase MutT (NUDIX family)
MFIPGDRLPPGFVASIGREGDVVVPRPAATVVLLRDGADGPEAFLLRRNRSSGFVPGAWVFAGGRVDEADADAGIWEGDDSPADPPPAYWAAAVRELFEETGVLLARARDGRFAPDSTDEDAATWRERLLEDDATLLETLAALDARPAIDRIVHIAHWITPVDEPRRYDTHFFLGGMPGGRVAAPDPREMSDAVWLRPADALDRFAHGRLPMVFPTVRTLEMLADFRSVDDALGALRGRRVAPILPRLVRTEGGVRLVVDEGAEGE